MAVAPSFERILIEVAQSFGSGVKTQDKHKISRLEKPLKLQNEIMAERVWDISNTLGLAEDQFTDIWRNLFESWLPFNKELELNLWTGTASQEQVLWHLLGYSYVPALARHLAFWQLDTTTDKGMPGGSFWYLPHLREAENGELEVALPVIMVIEWLMDLLGCPMDSAANGFKAQYKAESIERNLYNWWKKGQTPSVETINDYFREGSKFEFHGRFTDDSNLPLEKRWEEACAFIDRKKLTSEKLAREIPAPAELISELLEGKHSKNEQLYLIECLSERYAEPSLVTIRQRLSVARMMQDGYKRLLKFLCPGVDIRCADSSENKLLQLAIHFQQIYNLTVEANEECGRGIDEARENQYFESKIPDYLKMGLYQSIIKSYGFTGKDVGQALSRKFQKLDPNEGLADISASKPEDLPALIEGMVSELKAESDELTAASEFRKKINKGGAWKHLQKENDFEKVFAAAMDRKNTTKLQDLCLKRADEIASSPAERIGILLIQLSTHLNNDRRHFTKDSQVKVETLLFELEGLVGDNEQWKAPFLQYKAKHLVAQNDFDGALKLFKQALDACKTHNHGSLSGEIARDAFAVELSTSSLNINNHEVYFRRMLDGDIFQGANPIDIPDIEDVVSGVAEFFWDELYRPYHGFNKPSRFPEAAVKAHMDKVLQSLKLDDWHTVRRIYQESPLKTKRLQYAQGDTILMLWMKMFYSMRDQQRAFLNKMPVNELKAARQVLSSIEQIIKIVIEECPKLVDIADYKAQTPLMMAANQGDEALLTILLNAGATTGSQDYHGRTALHASVLSRSLKCTELLVSAGAKADVQTKPNKQNCLHAAVLSGHVKIVKVIAQQDMALVSVPDKNGFTPLELAQAASDSKYADMVLSDMRRHKRTTGSMQDYVKILQYLKDVRNSCH
ncbi:ankyrin repeat domain-containing protein [Endozoicomonas numazuensis]|uniref:Uncharacterized protein n=1 Tax=Endozoicomonas numazuensis TaxID=1137799 RepID=A0A081NEC9_9GAMM|nr:ankyrin repeat domain-containing protein [Endozoicomonas numazuensis]KEQ16802.1 hypothetical protein GZ78_19190 [Endozoicomonas numazuensis]